MTQQRATSQLPMDRKRLDVAIVGAPNAGKSQLLNILTQSPVAAVSRKRHTTRGEILGVRTVENTQIVFKDTPGYLTASRAEEERLDMDLISSAVSELDDVDFTLIVVDAARKIRDQDRHSLVQLMNFAMRSKGRMEEDHFESKGTITIAPSVNDRPRFAIVLNKVDLVKPKSLLIDLAMEIGELADACMAEHFGKTLEFDALMELSPITFYISALKEIGTDDLWQHLVGMATPCGVWAAEPGQSTTMDVEDQIQELIREKIYRCLHREVPHSIRQVNRLFRRLPHGVIIHQDLVVFKKSHQKLVHGSAGRTLQKIQDSATRDLSKLFGCDVLLNLNVKVNKSKQRRNPQDFGLPDKQEINFTEM